MYSRDYEILAKGNILLKNNFSSIKISEKKTQTINDIWNEEFEKNRSIFNDQVLCFTNFFKKANDVHVNVFFKIGRAHV